MKLNFMDDGLSIDESRKSTLIITFLVAFIIAMYCVLARGDIPSNMLNFLLGLITVIGAVNGANLVTKNKAQGGK